MTKRKLRKFTGYLIKLLVLLPLAQPAKACGWMEMPETYRIAMFSVLTPRMMAYTPFFYSADKFNDYQVDPEHNDRKRNCSEWLSQLGNSIPQSDVYVLLYNTSPDLFISSVSSSSLKADFEHNQFAAELLKPQNKAFLEYLLISKRIENWDFLVSDPWGEDQKNKAIDPVAIANELIRECEQKLKLEKNLFLKQRYAFQLVRLYQRTSMDDRCIEAVDQYFSNFSASILGAWAQLHKAIALSRQGKGVQANYLFSQSFAQSDEKKFRSMQLFVNDAKTVAATVQLAKSKPERANIISMALLQYPGPGLDRIRQVFQLDPKNEMIPLLVMREVNKCEDWIGTSKFTYNLPSLVDAGEHYNRQDSIKEVNLKHDQLYLKKLISVLDSMKNQLAGDTKDYFSIALAHLSFLDDQNEAASNYLAEIKANAPASILAQKYVDEIFDAASKMKLSDPRFHDYLAVRLEALERKVSNNKLHFKTLYSLARYFVHQYKQNKDEAMAGLFVLKAEKYKSVMDSQSIDQFAPSYYGYLVHFDYYAQLADMDKLVAMIKKPSTKLESYLCKGFSPEKFIELSGTIAFRENKMELSYAYFKQLPSDYWQKNYEFKNCLNEDPFRPKALVPKHKRKFNYSFNKTEFVAKLIELKKEAESNSSQSAEASLELAKALYNCTYFGNSWMMSRYSWSVYPNNLVEYTQDFGKPNTSELGDRIYFQCELAAHYYQLALRNSKKEETKAEAAAMLHRCDLNKFLFKDSQREDFYSFTDDKLNPLDRYSPIYLKEFSLYRKTKFYDELTSNCTEVRYFLARSK